MFLKIDLFKVTSPERYPFCVLLEPNLSTQLKKNSMEMQRALEHAAMVVDEACAENLIFRCGPCDVCNGNCFCQTTDKDLILRLMTGLKPVGSFVRLRKCEAEALSQEFNTKGLTSWYGKNRWKMWIVVAALNPDMHVSGVGTPRQMAFTQEFIDEELSLDVIGKLYGYRL